ncbi:MAG: hypothetical protein ABI759_16080 [Candidatus Solibacter sp.]
MIRPVVLFLALSQSAAAVELHIQFGALERMLTEQVFSQDGRRYVRGSKADKCNFAYLEKPQVRAQGSLLLIKAHFTGRSALNVAGQCVGLGDAFDVLITALPVYKSGSLALQEVIVRSRDKNGYYIRKVCQAMQSSLIRDFKYPLEISAQSLLEAPAAQPGYTRAVRKFNVPEIRVTSDSLVLQVDFELTVK